MGRTSKYNSEVTKCNRLWSVALYVRLSREDGDKLESESIGNQKEILTNYVNQLSDVSVFDVYVDDGYTGTSFDRPEFGRMLHDITDKKVDCVIVKDLSRFGRNYVEAGKYLETVFPLLGVRFISVNDNIDSYANPTSANDIMIPFKNIINDEYCRDISRKIRSTLDMKRKNGQFIGSFACYGYKKDPEDHNKLIIDEDAAEIVRLVFRLYLDGNGIITICKKLNAMGIKNPSAYKRDLGYKYHHSGHEKNDGRWGDSTVRRILKNEMYVGTMVQGKNRIVSYKIHVSKPVDKDNWMKVENAHERIIDKDTFNKVQDLLNRDTRTSPKTAELGLFAGFVKCADCGKAMNKKVISQPYKDYHYYVCSTYKKADKSACTKHTIRRDKLEQAVLATLQSQIALAVSMNKVMEAISKKGEKKKPIARLESMIAAQKKEINRIDSILLSIYPDLKEGIISKEQYLSLKSKYEDDKKKVEDASKETMEKIDQLKNGAMEENEFIKTFIKYENIQQLSRDILIELVDNVYVHEGGSITIALKYRDAFEDALKFANKNAS